MSRSPHFSFLMCSERSGSNLITRLMGSHPAVSAPTPTHLFRLILENLPRYGVLHDNANWSMLVDDVLALFATKLGHWHTDDTAAEILAASAGHGSAAELIAGLYEAEAKAEGAGHVFVKENRIYRFHPNLEAAFPEARYVYLVRDPRDMALSWKRAKAMRGGVVRASDVWRQDQDAFVAMHGRLASEKRSIAVRYESLVTEPETSLGRICSFLGLDYDPAMLDFHSESATRQAARIADWSNLGNPLDSGNFGKFRTGLDETEIRFIESTNGELMRTLGYEPITDAKPAEAAALRELLLPAEPATKPAFDDVSDVEKEVRRRRQEIVAAIEARPACVPGL